MNLPTLSLSLLTLAAEPASTALDDKFDKEISALQVEKSDAEVMLAEAKIKTDAKRIEMCERSIAIIERSLASRIAAKAEAQDEANAAAKAKADAAAKAKAEAQAVARQRAAEAQAIAEKEAAANIAAGKVLYKGQWLSKADALNLEIIESALVLCSPCEVIGRLEILQALQSGSLCTIGGKTVFILGVTQEDAVDGDVVNSHIVYECGNYTYTNTLGADRTVRKYSLSLRGAVEDRLAQLGVTGVPPRWNVDAIRLEQAAESKWKKQREVAAQAERMAEAARVTAAKQAQRDYLEKEAAARRAEKKADENRAREERGRLR